MWLNGWCASEQACRCIVQSQKEVQGGSLITELRCLWRGMRCPHPWTAFLGKQPAQLRERWGTLNKAREIQEFEVLVNRGKSILSYNNTIAISSEQPRRDPCQPGFGWDARMSAWGFPAPRAALPIWAWRAGGAAGPHPPLPPTPHCLRGAAETGRWSNSCTRWPSMVLQNKFIIEALS